MGWQVNIHPGNWQSVLEALGEAGRTRTARNLQAQQTLLGLAEQRRREEMLEAQRRQDIAEKWNMMGQAHDYKMEQLAMLGGRSTNPPIPATTLLGNYNNAKWRRDNPPSNASNETRAANEQEVKIAEQALRSFYPKIADRLIGPEALPQEEKPREEESSRWAEISAILEHLPRQLLGRPYPLSGWQEPVKPPAPSTENWDTSREGLRGQILEILRRRPTK